MNQRGRLENAHLVLVGSGDFSSVGAAIECRNPNVIVNSSRDDLYTFECTREDDDVTASCVRLNGLEDCQLVTRTLNIMSI